MRQAKIFKRCLLSYNSDLLRGIDCLAPAKEVLVTHAVRVEVTSILVADTVVAVVTVTALSARAAVETLVTADMRGVRSSLGVGLPDIHLRATRSVSAVAGVGIGRRG